MEIKLFNSNNPFELCANTYVLTDPSKRCVVIDPSVEEAIKYIQENNLKLVGVLLTHGHFDHIRKVDEIVELYHVPFYIHQKDEELLTNPKLNCSDRFSRKNLVVKAKPSFIKEGDILNLLDLPIKVIETPFHTLGSICYLLEQERVLFSGDSLFNQSVGRMDLPTSDSSLFFSSLAKLMSLDDNIIVYPGHGDETTIKNERLYNSQIQIDANSIL